MIAIAVAEQLAKPADHARILHPPERPGSVAVARKLSPEKWEERAYPIGELSNVLPALAGVDDVYLSTQRFWGWRRITQLAELGALYVDLDYYKRPALQAMHPLAILEDAQGYLERARIPAPSLAISSGRGLYLLWLHGPVPRAALPRWNACQKELWESLKPLSADRQALDAARVLRVIGTRHSGAGMLVEALTPPGEVWDFDALADEILPWTRAEMHDLRTQRALRRPQEPPRKPPQGYSAETLWEARLSDLQTLRRIRWFGELPPGQRDLWLFVAGVAMSWLVEPFLMTRELFALAREAGSWSEPEAASRMQAVFKRAHMARRGQRLEFGGVEIDPRYRFRSQTIIELLEITSEEERQMITLISEDERRRRDRERKEQERRRAGVQDRAAVAAQRNVEAHKLRSEGQSVSQIAQALGLSKRQIQRYLKTSTEGGDMSVRLYGGVASGFARSGV
jgi:DNA-binding CsgD family transcriptional regulator